MDLNELDFSESGEWPIAGKIAVLVLLCGLVWFGGYYYIIKDKQIDIAKAEKTEGKLKKDFEAKQKKAGTLAAYKIQKAEMDQSFSIMLKQLPRKNEVADLLVDISRTGLLNGLVFESFKPGAEHPVDFYAELPISMKVTGTYHQLSAFISNVVALPRIVTIHNVSMLPVATTGNITINISAKTYRYFDKGTN